MKAWLRRWAYPLGVIAWMALCVGGTYAWMARDARRCLSRCLAVQGYTTAERCEWACYEARGFAK